MERKSNHFSGQLGFVLAAAGSAVGVGNLWRFPYLAAKDGGGLFLIIYFINIKKAIIASKQAIASSHNPNFKA